MAKLSHYSVLRADSDLTRSIYIIKLGATYVLLAADRITEMDEDLANVPELDPPRNFVTVEQALHAAQAMYDDLIKQGWRESQSV